jgi:RNA polymerase sigma-70 factor (ECF subfamily)
MNDDDKLKLKIEDYYRRYGTMVLRRCLMFFPDEDEAKDAMQEVFVKLILNKHRLNGPYLSNLLFKISTNVCLNRLRGKRRNHSLTELNLVEAIAFYDEHEERTILGDFIDFIFRREKKSTREIAVMHYLEGMTLTEVSQEIGLSVSGVRKRLRVLQERVINMEVSNEN